MCPYRRRRSCFRPRRVGDQRGRGVFKPPGGHLCSPARRGKGGLLLVVVGVVIGLHVCVKARRGQLGEAATGCDDVVPADERYRFC